MTRAYRALATLACLCLASCGGTAQPTRLDRQWIDNEAGVIDQLQHDLVLGAIGGLGDARAALRSGLYIPLVAFTDFDGCDEMQRTAGSAPSSIGKVVRAMDA